LHRIELAVDKIIPYLLVLLLVIIILDIFYPKIIAPYSFEVEVVDYIIIAFFFVDLVFKFERVRKIPLFLRKYWIEIIALIPFFAVARIIEEIGGVFLASEDIARAQRIIHEGAKIEEELVLETGRSARFARIIRPLARFPRFAKAIRFFRKPEKHNQKP